MTELPLALDESHDPKLESWVATANDPYTDFPIQNLPFGRFRRQGETGWRIGVAIGDQVLDLRGAGVIEHADMQRLMSLPGEARRALRLTLSRGLRNGSRERPTWEPRLVAQSGVELGVPCDIGDYTDFYASVYHATTIGRQFRPDNPLLPNYKWVPIAYHGRASSIVASGSAFHRPMGQLKAADAPAPELAPSRRLDFELELAIFIGRGNDQGRRIAMRDAEDHVFGIGLLNDWSARDIQAWEYQPLGPFLSKSFASTVSPWMVTLDALAPFRQPFAHPPGDPQPLPYLDAPGNRDHGAISIELDVSLQTKAMREQGRGGDRLSRSNFKDAYWTIAQMVAHHTVNGCNLRPGDMFGSGTLSGPLPEEAASLLELTGGGRHPLRLSSGETRTYLEDGDRIILRGACTRDGFRRIGFGTCEGTLLPAI